MFNQIFRGAARTLPALVLALGLSATGATAATVITVDVTDPTAVVIATTGANADATASISAFRGFSLIDFFAIAPGRFNITNFASGTLDADSTNGISTAIVFDNYLNLYAFGAPDSYNFSVLSPAFTGAGTIDLSAIGAFLPTSGTGDIALGDDSPFGATIGQYQVISNVAAVPLPAGLPLLIAALGGLALVRRRAS